MLYNIKINPVLNGYRVVVGCQTIVFQTLAEMCKCIHEYYQDPEATEQRWRERAINAKYLLPEASTMAADADADAPNTVGMYAKASPPNFFD